MHIRGGGCCFQGSWYKLIKGRGNARTGARLALLQLRARGGQLLAEGVQLLRHALLRLRHRQQLRALLLQLLQRLLPLPPGLQGGLLLARSSALKLRVPSPEIPS